MMSDEHGRKGTWIQTYTGRAFWPLDPRPADVAIEDIAHALSLQCRFGGHCIRFYSVAEHSLLLSEQVPPPDRLWGLLHDAAEAYLVDVPRPVKQLLPDYRHMERLVMDAILRRFGLPLVMPASVRDADMRMLATERTRLMAPGEHPWGELDGVQPYEGVVFTPSKAQPHAIERAYLLAFELLSRLPRRVSEAVP